VVEDIRLAPEVLEPDPVDIAGNFLLFIVSVFFHFSGYSAVVARLAKSKAIYVQAFFLLITPEHLRLAEVFFFLKLAQILCAIAGSASLQRREAAGPASGDMNDGRWTGEASRKGGFRMEEQEVRFGLEEGLDLSTEQRTRIERGCLFLPGSSM
jgi:hypothetical protein